jgi:hypothetical protein
MGAEPETGDELDQVPALDSVDDAVGMADPDERHVYMRGKRPVWKAACGTPHATRGDLMLGGASRLFIRPKGVVNRSRSVAARRFFEGCQAGKG